jgi:hypothetical protein
MSKMGTQEINETLLSRKQHSCQKCKHRQLHLISQTQIQRKVLLGFLYKRETTCMKKHADTSEKYLCGLQILCPLIIISVRGMGLKRRTMIAQMMTSNYVTKA